MLSWNRKSKSWKVRHRPNQIKCHAGNKNNTRRIENYSVYITLENTSLTEYGKVHVLEGTETRLGTCSQISSLEGTSLSEVNTCKYKNTHDDVSG